MDQIDKTNRRRQIGSRSIRMLASGEKEMTAHSLAA
jgi:hypothetical protein